jgi:hypothetical protein
MVILTALCAVPFGAGCLFPGCVDYTDALCIPHVDTFCYQGQTYWLDSCDRVENVLEDCECGCRADQYGCRVCGEKECEEDADCPTGFFCDRTVWQCKHKECIPECDGKCCGDDGCDGTCPNNCPNGEICNASTCRCEGAVECRSNADCPRGYWCDRTVWSCRPEECIPNCTGKCCGDDGCYGTCPDMCPTGYTCDHMTCTCGTQQCLTDADCMATECCSRSTCVHMACGALECGPDPVCGKECGPCPAGSYCDAGRCMGGGQLCSPGQECTDLNDQGFLGCLIPPATVPPDNPTGCGATGTCDGNFFCHCINQNCSDSVCIELCGNCPAGQTCFELWDNGLWTCLMPNWQIPPDAPYCDGSLPCQGNAICYTDTVNNFCLYNCSSD